MYTSKNFIKQGTALMRQCVMFPCTCICLKCLSFELSMFISCIFHVFVFCMFLFLDKHALSFCCSILAEAYRKCIPLRIFKSNVLF